MGAFGKMFTSWQHLLLLLLPLFISGLPTPTSSPPSQATPPSPSSPRPCTSSSPSHHHLHLHQGHHQKQHLQLHLRQGHRQIALHRSHFHLQLPLLHLQHHHFHLHQGQHHRQESKREWRATTSKPHHHPQMTGTL